MLLICSFHGLQKRVSTFPMSSVREHQLPNKRRYLGPLKQQKSLIYRSFRNWGVAVAEDFDTLFQLLSDLRVGAREAGQTSKQLHGQTMTDGSHGPRAFYSSGNKFYPYAPCRPAHSEFFCCKLSSLVCGSFTVTWQQTNKGGTTQAWTNSFGQQAKSCFVGTPAAILPSGEKHAGERSRS
jgi:hypothetical protein